MFSKHLFCGLSAAFILLSCAVLAEARVASPLEEGKTALESLAVTWPETDTPSTVQELLSSPTLEELGERIADSRYDAVLICCDDAVNLRSAPIDGYVIRTIPSGRVLHVLARQGNWYRVVFHNSVGYVCGDYCEKVLYADYADEIAATAFRDNVIDYAMEWLGVRYRYGGNSKTGTDCSGFTSAVFGQLGYDLPHSAEGQFYGNPSVTTAERAAGDLVFFSTCGNYIGHVGIYLGNGQFIHASTSGGVRIDSLYDSYYGPRYVGACRVGG